MELRPAVAGDAGMIAAYLAGERNRREGEPPATTGEPDAPGWHAPLDRLLTTDAAAPEGQVVVADLDEVVIGHVWVFADPEGGAGRLHQLHLHPDHRRDDVADRLLESGRRLLATAGADRATAAVPAADTFAIQVLERAGWRPTGPAGSGTVGFDVRLDVQPHVVANRRSWDDWAASYASAGHRSYQPAHRLAPTWGIFAVPESEVGLLAGVEGCDVVELGCGTGYVSAWCLSAGARSVVGLDNSLAQLTTARSLQREFDVAFPLIWADAEHPPLAAGRFDVAVSEYGAAIWCDPYRWIPEAARLLRPGGRLAFLGNSVTVMLCAPDFEHHGPATATMARPQRGMHRLSFPDSTATEFHLSHGDMIRLLRASGFEVVDLIELYAPPGVTPTHDFADAEWASRWPVEEAWIARKVG